MILNLRYEGIGIGRSGKAEARFIPLSDSALKGLSGLEIGEYEVNITKPKNKRTLAQNRLLWELIGQISLAENGSHADTMDIYVQLIEQAGAKATYLQGLPEVQKELEKIFRVVQIVDTRESNGAETHVYKCFYGSSTFNTEEMSRLIDLTLIRAENDGIVTDYWKGLLHDTV